ncbi:methyltransferase [Yeosuana sp. MJ-SS3]|uniref:Methyltransferase n=1 Tax=Gilvirhabdus luticola TaxID=3079858 RepID=A0ABU3U7Q8_9FLAO|nr:methyltransferase [Yeosuana sp. MJ-SS3]MDU8886442.1 methyltransferase [Yeosuana sp. MJ-SS3]
MRKFFKKISNPFFQWWFKKYYSKPRSFKYENISITIAPRVFSPQYTFSTKILLKYLDTLDLDGKTLLELGCGSGIISLFASKKRANVTATDINKTALAYLKSSAKANQLEIEILYSDLFENLKNKMFDYIIINPPYYPRTPKSVEESAWFCGPNFEYFQKLFNQLQFRITNKSNCFMILSEDCNIEKIQTIANSNNLDLNIIKVEKNFWETNYIFKVS